MLWIAWILAGVLAFAWLAVAVHATFADRSRGRRRCPGCFYDFADADHPACPECGRGITPTSKLHKTRRHWGRVVLASLFLLLPAVVTAGAARIVQTGGWAELPGPVLTRMLWLEHAPLDAAVQSYLGSPGVSTADAARVLAFGTSRLASRVDEDVPRLAPLLEAACYALMKQDDPGPFTPRELRSQLPPGFVEASLWMARDGGPYQDEGIRLLGEIRQADPRATATLLALTMSTGASSPASRTAHDELNWSRVIANGAGRPVIPLRLYLTISRLSLGMGAPGIPPGDLRALGDALNRRCLDVDAITTWARSIARNDPAEFAQLGIEPAPASKDDNLSSSAEFARGIGLLLWAVSAQDPEGAKATLIEQGLAGNLSPDFVADMLVWFPWDDRTESTLRAIIDDNFPPGRHDLHALAPGNACVSASCFGREAAALLPALRRHVDSIDAGGPGNHLVGTYKRLGGDPRDLIDPFVARLNRAHAWLARFDQPYQPSVYEVGPHRVRNTLAEITNAGLIDTRLVEALEPWLTAHSDGPKACVAYAACGGDPVLATQRLLEHQPDFTASRYSDERCSALIWLIQLGHADPAALVERFNATGSDAQLAGLLDRIATEWGIPKTAVERLGPLLDLAVGSSDPAVIAAVESVRAKFK